MPRAGCPAIDDIILERNVPLSENGPDPEKSDRVMLIKKRLSRIYFKKIFFNYPISINYQTIRGLGLLTSTAIGLSYIKSRIFPVRSVNSLEDFFINRFGKKLYTIFFKDYTEKVWGMPCSEINPDWGVQRIKGLSITKVLLHWIKKILSPDSGRQQNRTETSLIEQFLYPKLGPGQFWEYIADTIRQKGGKILLNHRVCRIFREQNRIIALDAVDDVTGKTKSFRTEYLLSSMTVKNLINALDEAPPARIVEIANGLIHRDFITVGVLLKKLTIKNTSRIRTINNIIPDNWIYMQDRAVKLGRIQIYNNWSPYMVKDIDTVWLGLEYFCNQGDDFWEKADEEISTFALTELEGLGFISRDDVLDSTVIRMPDTYPVYWGSYSQLQEVITYTDKLENLFLIGRNGMHRYNNQDHSMLTAMTAVENIAAGKTSKENIWSINIEEEYHESKGSA